MEKTPVVIISNQSIEVQPVTEEIYLLSMSPSTNKNLGFLRVPPLVPVATFDLDTRYASGGSASKLSLKMFFDHLNYQNNKSPSVLSTAIDLGLKPKAKCHS
uniref:Uncharacterized protein n=1 Tax=Sphaerodactylus townsendi TaxID=933632 RepID=A0ACB8F911_9SAUR